MAPRSEPAVRARLSPTQDAFISGPGRVHLMQGRLFWHLDEREMRRLVEEWQAYEAQRRHAPTA